jgi:hypothetical protein
MLEAALLQIAVKAILIVQDLASIMALLGSAINPGPSGSIELSS